MKSKLTPAIFGAFMAAALSSASAAIVVPVTSQDIIRGSSENQTTNPNGYHPDTGDTLNAGTLGAGGSRRSHNAVLGFILPTLNPGETITSAIFSITIESVANGGGNITVSLHGLTTSNPDVTGTDLFYQSEDGALNANFAATSDFDSGSPARSHDVTDFINGFYTNGVPDQDEVFFRINQNTHTSVGLNPRRITFEKGSATLELTIIPEPSSTLLCGFGVLSLALRRRR